MASPSSVPTPGYGFTVKTTVDDSDSTAEPDAFLFPHHPPTLAKELIAVANALVRPRGRGIYATDETPEGIEARLEAAAESDGRQEAQAWTEGQKKERRMRWRECLYQSLPTEYISGVILHSETLLEFKLAPILEDRGIIPGVRADTDSQPLPISPLEPATQGLDDLLPRLQEARKYGARFSKWRAPILCDSGTFPSQAALECQAETLARFAAISQQAGLVPIVEPDVDFSANASLQRSVEVHIKAIGMIYARCLAYGVLLEGSLIKPSFPQPGAAHHSRAKVSAEVIGRATATVLARSVPVGVAGVVFLSGGLSDQTASDYLRAVNDVVDESSMRMLTSTAGIGSLAENKAEPSDFAFARLPPLTFSFGRGLQGEAMTKWVKGDENDSREAFRERAKVCWAAVRSQGQT